MTDTRPPVSRRRLAAIALAGGFLALTGCSGSSGSGSSAAATTGATASGAPASDVAAAATTPPRIVIKNFAFHPAKLTVKPGVKVTVVNQDSTAHTVTATKNKEFNTKTIGPGKTVTFTAPKAAGTYDYICTIHTFMKGKLIVG